MADEYHPPINVPPVMTQSAIIALVGVMSAMADGLMKSGAIDKAEFYDAVTALYLESHKVRDYNNETFRAIMSVFVKLSSPNR